MSDEQLAREDGQSALDSLLNSWMPEVVALIGVSYIIFSLQLRFPVNFIGAAAGLAIVVMAAKVRYEVGFSQLSVQGSLFNVKRWWR